MLPSFSLPCVKASKPPWSSASPSACWSKPVVPTSSPPYGAALPPPSCSAYWQRLPCRSIGAEFEGRAEEIFEGVTMLAAAALLTWMIFWMHRQGANIQHQLELDVTTATRRGAAGLFAVAFLAVAREGLELALFLTASTLSSGALYTLIGALFGLAVAALLGYLLFASARRLSLKRFFLVTNTLLVLFAAGLVAHAVHEFTEPD